MEFDHRTLRARTSGVSAADNAAGPGKRSLTEQLPVQRCEVSSAPGPSAATGGTSASTPSVVSRPTLQMLFGIQRRATAEDLPPTEASAPVDRRGRAADRPAAIRAAAARGVASPASALPYADHVQRLFGRHDISSIQAHTGGAAATAAREMGAAAYATGNHVVLGAPPDLFTVAHEAAHVVQQRAEVQLLGGIGGRDDAYERHADEVAARVVQGRSAEDLLDCAPGGGPRSPARTATAASGEPVVQGAFYRDDDETRQPLGEAEVEDWLVHNVPDALERFGLLRPLIYDDELRPLSDILALGHSLSQIGGALLASGDDAIVPHILSLLDVRDLCALRLVSRGMQRGADHELAIRGEAQPTAPPPPVPPARSPSSGRWSAQRVVDPTKLAQRDHGAISWIYANARTGEQYNNTTGERTPADGHAPLDLDASAALMADISADLARQADVPPAVVQIERDDALATDHGPRQGGSEPHAGGAMRPRAFTVDLASTGGAQPTLVIRGASVTLAWGAAPVGTEPSLGEHGTVTANNWQSVIATLAAYRRNMGSGSWHMLAATEAHEQQHVRDYLDLVQRAWRDAAPLFSKTSTPAALPSRSTLMRDLEASDPAQRDERRANMAANGLLETDPAKLIENQLKVFKDTLEVAWIEKTIALSNAEPLEGRAFAVGQRVHDQMIEQIRRHAAANAWPSSAQPEGRAVATTSRGRGGLRRRGRRPQGHPTASGSAELSGFTFSAPTAAGQTPPSAAPFGVAMPLSAAPFGVDLPAAPFGVDLAAPTTPSAGAATQPLPTPDTGMGDLASYCQPASLLMCDLISQEDYAELMHADLHTRAPSQRHAPPPPPPSSSAGERTEVRRDDDPKTT